MFVSELSRRITGNFYEQAMGESVKKPQLRIALKNDNLNGAQLARIFFSIRSQLDSTPYQKLPLREHTRFFRRKYLIL